MMDITGFDKTLFICRCTGYRPILDAFKSFACSTDIEDLKLCRVNGDAQNGHRFSMEGKCERKCKRGYSIPLEIRADDGKMWLKPINLSDLLRMFTRTIKSEYMLVAGNTAHGVYRRSGNINVFIDIKSIPELHSISGDESSLTFGGNVSLTEFMETLESVGKKYENYSYATRLARHVDLVASVPIRNAGTVAGNLSIKHAHNEFQSDVFLLLETIGAQLNIISVDGSNRLYSPKDYLSLDMHQKVILNIVLPKLDPNRFEFRSYKIMPRAQNAHAIVNAGFLFELESSDGKRRVKYCRICYGGISPEFIHAEATEKLLSGVDDLCTNEISGAAIKSLQNEIVPDSNLIDPPAEYRRNLAVSLFYRFLLSITPASKLKSEFVSGSVGLERPLSAGSQIYQSNEKTYPLTQPMSKYEGLIQCAGEAEYVNDMFSSQNADNELWAAFVPATQVHSKIVSIDATEALNIPGVEAFFSAKDIPGENTYTPLQSDFPFVDAEVVFVEVDAEVKFHGQPCGIILAKTMALAYYSAETVKIVYEKTKNNRQIIPSIFHKPKHIEFTRNITRSSVPPNQSVEVGMLKNQKKISGDMKIGSQYHFSMEPQTTFCFPNDDGGLNVYSSTQWFDLVHVAISKYLKLPQSKIYGHFKRLGGSYGAKTTYSSHVAVACALACYLTRRPVRFVLTIESNMNVIGKRYANFVDYQASVDSVTGHLNAFEFTVAQDFGCNLNDDTAFIIRETLDSTCYSRSCEWKFKVERIKTDSPSATWCRSPGTNETTAILENLMEHIAHETNRDPATVRLNNLNENGPMYKIFPEFLTDTEYFKRRAEINRFNNENRWKKRGIGVAIMGNLIHYFCSHTAYIAIYHGDGSVVISHSGTEMGQGINTKVSQTVSYLLGIPLSFITVSPFSTTVAANISQSGASITSESVCQAAKKACDRILERLKPVRDQMSKEPWIDIIQEAWRQSIDLTQKETFRGSEAKDYDVVGCACTEIEVDVLTGNLQILRVDIAEDVGNSMNPLVDVGQIEGAFIMGMGYWLMEKLNYDGETGELATNRTWTYKVPSAKDIPIDFRVKFLQGVKNDGIFGSKATGEPAFNLAVSAVFALRHAIDAIRSDNGKPKNWYRLGSGNTPDVVFNAAGVNVNDFKLN